MRLNVLILKFNSVQKNSENSICFLKFDNLSLYPNINHFISTRKGGVSSSPIDELNLGFTVGDDPENVIKNRKLLASSVGIPFDSFVFQNQIHSDSIKTINKKHRGRGAYEHKNAIPKNDAMITNETNICLFVFSADCVPILLFDPKKKVIAAIHAGWQGTVKKITEKTVYKMKEEFQCNPENIIASIGPSISVENYEVGENVANAIIDSFGTKDKYLILNSKTNKYHFDLWYTNKQQLKHAGLLSENIEISQLCTFKHEDLFYSARRDKYSGRMGCGIIIKGL